MSLSLIPPGSSLANTINDTVKLNNDFKEKFNTFKKEQVSDNGILNKTEEEERPTQLFALNPNADEALVNKSGSFFHQKEDASTLNVQKRNQLNSSSESSDGSSLASSREKNNKSRDMPDWLFYTLLCSGIGLPVLVITNASSAPTVDDDSSLAPSMR